MGFLSITHILKALSPKLYYFIVLCLCFMLPRVTDSELVQDPRRFVAPHRYSPASVDAML